MIILQVVDCWLWSMIFLIQGCYFNGVWILTPDMGVWGGFPPQYSRQRGPGAGDDYFGSPLLVGVQGKHPHRENLGKNAL